jgi:XTP/dITP diphosphohydrolase
VTSFVLATANPHKAEEITAILDGLVLDGLVELVPRPASVGDVEETGSSLLENARLKAVALVEATGLPALADDTGLEVDALGGDPGVYSARYAGEDATYADNVAKLLAALEGSDDRRARFLTIALARWPDGVEVFAEGVVTGTIARSARGEGGFGYDPVFVPDEGDGRTFAEQAAESGRAKHRLSHRGRAFTELAARLAPMLDRPAGAGSNPV